MDEKKALKKPKVSIKEKALADLYREMLSGIATDQTFINIVAQMLYQTIQATIFQAANKAGYDMEALKNYLDEVVKEFTPTEQENQEETNNKTN